MTLRELRKQKKLTQAECAEYVGIPLRTYQNYETDEKKRSSLDYDVEYCYLFGSYAKGKATEESDVDLLVSTSVTGMRFYEIVEALREGLKKKVDLLNVEQLKDNLELLNEILKDGIKVYG